MRCRLCRYVRGINELQAVWVYMRGINEILAV